MTSVVDDEAGFEALLAHIREIRGFDFTGYKQASLSRRIAKRMQDVGATTYEDYLRVLERSKEEFTALFDTILINVTSFFLDGEAWAFLGDEAWAFLGDEVLAALAERSEDAPIRVWCAGCASGQEAYTLAILLCEALGEERFRRCVKIYGSDADEDALASARRARFPEAPTRAAVGEERVGRFFTPVEDELLFRSDLRRSVIFGRHDLMQDPPISRVDLVTCRNTLMYFTASAQRAMLASFHFALNDGGHLFLGKSEALASRSDLFQVVDLKHHLFVRNGVRPVHPRPKVRFSAAGRREMGDGIDRLLDAAFENSSAAQVLVDGRGTLVAANRHARHLFGIGGDQIGAPFKDLEVSYRPVELRSRIDRVLHDRRTVTVTDSGWTAADGSTETFETRLQPIGPDLDSLGVATRSWNRGGTGSSAISWMTPSGSSTPPTSFRARSRSWRPPTRSSSPGFLESILGSLSSAIVVLDKQMAVQVWNAKAEELWGCGPTRWRGIIS